MRLTPAIIVLVLSGCADPSTPKTDSDKSLPNAPADQQTADNTRTDTVEDTDRSTGLLPDGPTEKDYPHLHNLFQVTDRIYSGGEPKDEQAFAELAKLGVTVIVSVDGARPKVELAKKYGMRYVHIPIGYDGIGPGPAKSFARAADELHEKTYVHCHHGRHRGPAAAAAICVARGNADGRQALKILEKAGTSKGYSGLWRDVGGYQRPAAGEELPELVPVAEVGSLAAAMAKIDRASDNLKLCQAAGWQTPADHPDISPPQEALLLKEGFRETVRQLAESNDYGEPLLTWMKQSEQTATQLEAALKAGDMAAVKSNLAEVQSQCKQCHNDYRN